MILMIKKETVVVFGNLGEKQNKNKKLTKVYGKTVNAIIRMKIELIRLQTCCAFKNT